MTDQKLPDGLFVKEFDMPFEKLLEKLRFTLESNGFKVFAVIDHRKAAMDVGMDMFQASVIIFGNPAGGTNLMKETPTMAIDMPARILTMDDGSVKIYFNKLSYVQERHVHGTKNDTASKFDTRVINLIETLQ